MTPLPSPVMCRTAMRWRVALAVPHAGFAVGVTSLQAEDKSLAQRRKYRTAWRSNAGHNCSRERSAISMLGIGMHPEINT